MFTGLIECMGTMRRVSPKGNYRELTITPDTPFAEIAAGESIAVSGPCLTVTAHDDRSFTVEASPETVAVTTLGKLREGSRVNLERALRADARFGGHFVSGHIDAVLRVKNIQKAGLSLVAEMELPERMAPLIVDKGSVALDGISLTVISVDRGGFRVNLIPETQARTTWGGLKAGDEVNVEFDLIGKYIVRVLQQRNPGSTLTIDVMRDMGY